MNPLNNTASAGDLIWEFDTIFKYRMPCRVFGNLELIS